MQRVIVLAGLPGSGKSTLAQRLHAAGWAWVNQVLRRSTQQTALCRQHASSHSLPSAVWQQISSVFWSCAQDVLGSRRACEDAVAAALAAGAEVVVDRCNFDEQQRSTWVALARRFRAAPVGLQLQVSGGGATPQQLTMPSQTLRQPRQP